MEREEELFIQSPTVPATDIVDLHDDVLALIFEHVPALQRRTTLPLVCKRFSHIVGTHTIFRDVTIDFKYPHGETSDPGQDIADPSDSFVAPQTLWTSKEAWDDLSSALLDAIACDGMLSSQSYERVMTDRMLGAIISSDSVTVSPARCERLPISTSTELFHAKAIQIAHNFRSVVPVCPQHPLVGNQEGNIDWDVTPPDTSFAPVSSNDVAARHPVQASAVIKWIAVRFARSPLPSTGPTAGRCVANATSPSRRSEAGGSKSWRS